MPAERKDEPNPKTPEETPDDAGNGMADPEARAKAAAEWQRLRGEIDSGRTGDKVGYPDKATSPLGTDDEAGGAVVPPPPAPGRSRTPATGATADAGDAGFDGGGAGQMDRNVRRQPGPRDVLPERKRRDRMMLALGVVIGLAFFAILVAI
jgi:hypothetical protein